MLHNSHFVSFVSGGSDPQWHELLKPDRIRLALFALPFSFPLALSNSVDLAFALAKPGLNLALGEFIYLTVEEQLNLPHNRGGYTPPGVIINARPSPKTFDV